MGAEGEEPGAATPVTSTVCGGSSALAQQRPCAGQLVSTLSQKKVGGGAACFAKSLMDQGQNLTGGGQPRVKRSFPRTRRGGSQALSLPPVWVRARRAAEDGGGVCGPAALPELWGQEAQPGRTSWLQGGNPAVEISQQCQREGLGGAEEPQGEPLTGGKFLQAGTDTRVCLPFPRQRQ